MCAIRRRPWHNRGAQSDLCRGVPHKDVVMRLLSFADFRSTRATLAIPALAGLLGFSALAAAPTVAFAQDEVSPEAAQAEYVRLSREIQRFAERNAWSGVERSYQAILANGTAPSQSDHLYGARAAKEVGNAAAVRQRLEAAIALGENSEAYDWAWEFDSTYGKVDLACDPGALQLAAESMPFQPDLAAAVRFAQADLLEDGIFKGHLPAGNYTFGPYTIEVIPRVQSVQIDARGAIPAERPPREARPPREERPPRETRTPRETQPREARPPREERPPRVPPTGDADPTPHLAAVLLGAGNRFGAAYGGGAMALFRIPAGPISIGLDAGIGYDLIAESMGGHVGGRLYAPAIEVGGANTLSVFAGAGYSPMVQTGVLAEGKLACATVNECDHKQTYSITPVGMDIRVGPVVIDGSWMITNLSGASFEKKVGFPAGPDDTRWFQGYSVGLGVGFP